MSHYPKLQEVQMVWRDLVDSGTQHYFDTFTAVDLETMIRREVESSRTQIQAGRACGLNTDAFVEYAKEKPLDDILARAYFIGGERGSRIGKARAHQMIIEARWAFRPRAVGDAGGDDS